MSDPQNICGPRVRKFREKRKWTPSELAAKCQLAGLNFSRETITRIETRARFVGDWELKALARILGVDCEALIVRIPARTMASKKDPRIGQPIKPPRKGVFWLGHGVPG